MLHVAERFPLPRRHAKIELFHILIRFKGGGISVEHDLLSVEGQPRQPDLVYRKIQPVKLAILTKIEDSWE